MNSDACNDRSDLLGYRCSKRPFEMTMSAANMPPVSCSFGVCEVPASRGPTGRSDGISAKRTCAGALSNSGLEEAVQHWRTSEAKLHEPAEAMWKVQDQVTPRMRQMLVEWLFQVCHNLRLNHETFFITISILDRFLSRDRVARTEFQLVGITCLWVAAKYEEERPPSAQALLTIADDCYSTPDMLTLEVRVLNALGFELGMPTCLKFMDYFWQVTSLQSLPTKLLAIHLMELSTLAAIEPKASCDSLAASAAQAPALPAEEVHKEPVNTQKPGSGEPTASTPLLHRDSSSASAAADCAPPVGCNTPGYEPIQQHLPAAASAGACLIRRRVAAKRRTTSPAPSALQAGSSLPTAPAQTQGEESSQDGLSVTFHPSTPEVSAEPLPLSLCCSPKTPLPLQQSAHRRLQQRQRLLTPDAAAACCLAEALPSHLSAAALMAALAMQQQQAPSMLLLLADLAACEPEYILDLSQAMCHLHTLHSSAPGRCPMVDVYRCRKQRLAAQQAMQQAWMEQHAHLLPRMHLPVQP